MKFSLRAAAVLLVLLSVIAVVFARGSGPDTDLRVIPYQGVLEQDGVPVSSVIPMTFVLDGTVGGLAQQYTWGPQDVEVFSGEFRVLIGEGEGVPDWVYDAPDVTVSITVDGVTLANAQRILPVPYAHWTAEGTDILVEGDLDVVDGCINFQNAGSSNHTHALCNDDALFADEGVTLRALTNPGDATPLFRVVSEGGAERLRVEHNGTTSVGNHLSTTGNASIGGTLGSTGPADFDSSLTVDGAADLNSSLTVDGNVQFNGTTDIMGAYNSRSVTTTYNEASDGFVFGWARRTGAGGHCYIDAYVNNTLIARPSNRVEAGQADVNFMFPVPRGANWRVTQSTCSSVSLYWVPMGGG